MKEKILAAVGLIGGAAAQLWGGWSGGMTTLVVFMALDYLSGLVVAAVFKRSQKSETGALSSRASFQGLLQKGMMLLVVLVACRLDLLLGSRCIRDGTVIAFCVNECISILENAGRMGVPIPRVIRDAVEVLRQETNGEEARK